MKALLHFAPRAGSGAAFGHRMRALTGELRARAAGREIAVNAMTRVARDPMGRHTPWRATLEIRGPGLSPEALASWLKGLGARVEDVVHADLATLLVGEEVVFIACDRAPVRYQYLMRRNASFTHAGYLTRYRDIHSRFGLATPGIRGYTQLHVDPEASRSLAGEAGLGVWGVDSVSELHLDSVEIFLAAIAKSDIGPKAIADEEVFVDRERSLDFCSRVEWDGP